MTYSASLEVAAGDCEYTIRHTGGGCVLIFGSVPAADFSTIAKLCPSRNAVMDPQAADMAGANFAFGLRADLDALKQRLSAGAMEREARRRPGLAPELTQWLATGQRGASSETIFQHLTGVETRDGARLAHPHDPDDVKRCRLLLEACPLLQVEFHRMAGASPTWGRLVAAWPAICAAMDEESPRWREGVGKAPRTAHLISEALKA